LRYPRDDGWRARTSRSGFQNKRNPSDGEGLLATQGLHALKQHYKGKLKLTDVKEMFLELKDHA
jgi:hypothetical protein